MTMRIKLLGRRARNPLYSAGAAALLACASPQLLAADSESAAELGDIVVTAQSRSQQVQDVPIPLQIVTSAQIDSLAATDLSKMDGYIPGLVVGGEHPTQPKQDTR